MGLGGRGEYASKVASSECVLIAEDSVAGGTNSGTEDLSMVIV
jgi:hypothetical protein